jgi:hypothetical protein
MNARLHHTGIIVANIEAYLANSFWELRGEIVTDPLQQARLCMVGLPGEEAKAELIEPIGENSRMYAALQRGPGPHHLCFHVATMTDGDALIREYRLLPVTPWEPAVLFAGRAVRFVYSRSRELMELLCDEIIA